MCNDVILTLFIYVFLYLLWCVLSGQRILLIAVHPCMLYSSHSPTSPVAQHTAPFYSIPHCHTHICSYPTYWYPLHHLVHSILGTKTSLSVTFYHTLLLCCVFLIYNNKPIFIFLPFFFFTTHFFFFLPYWVGPHYMLYLQVVHFIYCLHSHYSFFPNYF